MTRLILSSLLVAGTVSALPAQTPASAYTQVSIADSSIGGKVLSTLAFDAKANRLYAGSRLGLFWVNVADAKPVWKGPMFSMDIRHIEFAPQLNRVFFIGIDGVGYVDVDALGAPKMISKMIASDMAYEPTRREIYVTSRAPRVDVFDGATGEPGAVVDLPGWLGIGLEAIPGRVFLMQGKVPGLFAIDAKTHTLAPFKTSEKITTPVYLEADPAGRYLFATYYQTIVAIDPASGKVLGRKTVPTNAAIAFDPGSGLLIATWADEPTPVRVAAFRVDASGLTEVSEFKNPRVGGIGVEPTSHGFVQAGVNRFYIWATSPG
jgi:hypothetical protein